ncbi:TfuA-like protein [Streptomyces sp. NPDC048508]|uniref:TfuA-like protein n=1 Tax=Streptomyces sp. NPDC048508 TaxID=3365561 RepID=UPI0037190D99
MTHVYVGPTLEKSVPEFAEPGMRVCPPARHGDLIADALRDGDTVVLIDGVYHQAPALRHKEILAAMGRGVRVIGAASIGALRAAELAPFGMLGVGAVYTAYAQGKITGDDEVAVDELTVKLLLAGETAQARQSVARFRATLDARCAQAGFSTGAVRDDLTRRLLLGIWKCPEHRFDAEASARGLVSGARAVAAAKRLVPGLLEEAGEVNDDTELGMAGSKR